MEAQPSLQSVRVVQTTYEYHLHPARRRYELRRVYAHPHTFRVQDYPIERLQNECIALFACWLTHACNHESLRLVFADQRRVFVCAPHECGRLRVLRTVPRALWDCQAACLPPGAAVVDEESLLQHSDLACSMHSVMFDYVRTPSQNYLLIGIMALPSYGIHMPKIMHSCTLRQWLHAWVRVKLGACMRDARLLLRDDEHTCRVLMVADHPRDTRRVRTLQRGA